MGVTFFCVNHTWAVTYRAHLLNMFGIKIDIYMFQSILFMYKLFSNFLI
jgi:hypothetical protein